MTDTGDRPRGYTLLQMWPAVFGGVLFAALMFFAPVILAGGYDEPTDEPATPVEESPEPLPAEIPERFQPNGQLKEHPSNSWID